MTSLGALGSRLEERLKSRSATVGVVGLGYVGLPLAVTFARAGFQVIGVDADPARAALLAGGLSPVEDVPGAELAPLVQSGRLGRGRRHRHLRAHAAREVEGARHLLHHRGGRWGGARAAARHAGGARVHHLSRHHGRGAAPAHEPGRAPGGRGVLPGVLARAHRSGQPDLGALADPEGGGGRHPGVPPSRRDPLPPDHRPRRPGLLHAGRGDGEALREHLPQRQHRARQRAGHHVPPARHVGLGGDRGRRHQAVRLHGLLPGPGIGGHCLPSDPHYLSWRTRLAGYEAKFIAFADEINGGMPRYVVQLAADALNDREKAVKGSRILALGVAYKAGVGDIRDSPALEIIEDPLARGARLEYADPRVPQIQVGGQLLESVAWAQADLSAYDLVVLLTAHPEFEPARLVRDARLVLDTRNATGALGDFRHVIKI